MNNQRVRIIAVSNQTAEQGIKQALFEQKKEIIGIISKEIENKTKIIERKSTIESKKKRLMAQLSALDSVVAQIKLYSE